MSALESDSSEDLPVELSRKIVEACERFEVAWKAGQPAAPEDFVSDFTPSTRNRILAELDRLAAELQAEEVAEPPPGATWTTETTSLERFHILRAVARGGMGQISEALDRELDRLVAFKEILPAGANDPEYRRRFQIEAEITARLEHPGIIPVYNRGRLPDGRLFYTMRLISGDQSGTLKQALEAFHRPSPRDAVDRDSTWRTLLRRVIDVCNTMAYVHGEGILHRDLKPSNILLGPYGETLVVDWGLARCIHAPASGAGSVLPGLFSDSPLTTGIGTVGHAAPEQLSDEGSSTSPSSDLYSLGTILYTVLTGQPPFPSTSKSNPQPLVDRVREGRFHRPSALNPLVDPALEAICVKAMALRPQDRYDTASDLAKDLERWLAGEPVRAWREPLTRRLRRWVQRHQTLVTASALGLILLSASLGVLASMEFRNRRNMAVEADKLKRALTESREAREESDRQRARAELEQRHAHENEVLAVGAVAEFQRSVSESRELKSSAELAGLRKDLLGKPLAFYRKLREQLLADQAPTVENLKMLREATTQLAALELDVGDTEAAIELYASAINVCDRVLSQGSPGEQDQLDWRLAKAESHRVRGWAFNKVNRLEAELAEFDAAVEQFQEVIRQRPDQPHLEGLCGLAIGERAHSLARNGRLDEARPEFDRALSLLSAASASQPGTPEARRQLARTHYNYSLALRQLRDSPAATEQERLADSLFAELGDNGPQDPQFIHRLAAARFNEGIDLSRLGNHAGALAAYRLAENSWRQLVLTFPADNEYQNGLRLCLRNIILELGHLGQSAEQLPAWLELASLTRSALSRSPGTEELQQHLLEACHIAGHLLQQQGRVADAQVQYGEALPIAAQLGDAQPQAPLWRRHEFDLRVHRGTFEIDQGRLEEAQSLLSERFDLVRDLATRPGAASADRQVYRSLLSLRATTEERLGNQSEADTLWTHIRTAEDVDPDLQPLLRRLGQIAGGVQPVDQAERWQLAQTALARREFLLAARLYADALEREPESAENRQTRPRYQAARSAIRAAAGQADPASETAQRWRRQAFTWLRAEVDAIRGELERDRGLATSLNAWLQDPDWSSVRSPSGRQALPPDEQTDWTRLFEDMQRLQSQAP
jgi:serine/threonine protein kinase